MMSYMEHTMQAVTDWKTENFTEPNWAPLEKHFTELYGKPDRCADYMWMYSDKGLEYYKHCDTRAYLVLSQDGR